MRESNVTNIGPKEHAQALDFVFAGAEGYVADASVGRVDGIAAEITLDGTENEWRTAL